MKKIVLIVGLTIVVCGSLDAVGASAFEKVMEHYEPIRLALLVDSMDGVNENGRAIGAELRALEVDFSAGRAGATGEAVVVVREHLDEMIAAADAIAAAESLEDARDGIYALTKPMVRWRHGVAEKGRPAVAYCSMYKRSWLQPDGEIGNPYGGMPRCGEIVAR